jgi:hypothetical protein
MQSKATEEAGKLTRQVQSLTQEKEKLQGIVRGKD